MADARFSEDFWTDPKISRLDMDTQRLFIYLFTNPHRNYCGLYYLPKTYIREQTGLSDRAIDRGIDTLSREGFIEYSEEYKVVFVKNMLKRQAGELAFYLNAKQIKGIEKHLATLHGCPLIKKFIDRYGLTSIQISINTPTNTPTNTPMDTPMDAQSQSQSQSQSRYIPLSKKLKPKKPTATTLPENFTISDRVRTWAKEKGFSHLEEQLEWFKDWARAHGKQYADWDAAIMNCIRGNWGKIDLTAPERKPSPKTICPNCQHYVEKCICHDPEAMQEWREYQERHHGKTRTN